jgi:site-specific recombinase XerC
MDRGTMSTLVAKTIRRELGLEMNPHLFRHLAATNYLRMHPGEYEVVRQLIGHTRTSNTIAYYAAFEPLFASQRYGSMLEELVR